MIQNKCCGSQMSRIIFHVRCFYQHKYSYCTVRNFSKGRLHECQNVSSSYSISPEDVLSHSNRENCIKLLNSVPAAYKSLTENVDKAAVLVPLCKINGQLALLFTVRARHLKANGGEVAFPGGMSDKSDGDIENTALREAYEEVGIQSNKVDIWGKGQGYFFKTMQNLSHKIGREGVTVTPVLGYIGELQLDKLKINSNEVSHAFAVTLEHLSSVNNFRTTRFRSGKNKTSVFRTPVYLNSNKRIWGFTAFMTHIILSSLIPNIYRKNIKYKPSIQKVLQSQKK